LVGVDLVVVFQRVVLGYYDRLCTANRQKGLLAKRQRRGEREKRKTLTDEAQHSEDGSRGDSLSDAFE